MGKSQKNILLCAGGTGGHLFPAHALARELSQRGWNLHLVTDGRAHRFASDFPATEIHVINSATVSVCNPFKMVRALYALAKGCWQSWRLVKKLNPAMVIGFGGYPTVPPVMMSSFMRPSILLHEQNAVMGRANRLLAGKADVIVMGFSSNSKDDNPGKRILGNPVRAEILEAAQTGYRLRDVSDPFNLLIFGGSQGAKHFSRVLPGAIDLLEPTSRARLNVVQQAHDEDLAELSKAFASLSVKSEVAQFFSPMALRIAQADLVIARAGASTISELAAIGRPSILVPYPYALDHDQAMNASEMEKAGGCMVIRQADLTSERLAKELKNAISNPGKLTEMAKNAKRTARMTATEDFARLVEHVMEGQPLAKFR